MATAICVKVPNLPSQMELTMPGIGPLMLVRDSLEKLPRPSAIILKFFSALQPAMAPLHSIIKILDMIIAIFNCVTAIPKCFVTLNPGPLIKCFEKLFKAFAALVALFPPITYVRLVRDIIVLVRTLIDDMLSVLTMIDVQISAVKAQLAKAIADNDTIMLEIGNCAKNDILKQTEGLQMVLELIGKFLAIPIGIMQLIADLVPGADKALEPIIQVVAAIGGGQLGSDGFPLLTPLAQMLGGLRDALYVLESFLNAVLGISTTFTLESIPQFKNS